jgi:uncharacterized protein (DUF849 family)
LLLQACLNGNRTRAEHDLVPLTPEELASDARAASAAGARTLHVHPRSDDGSESIDADDVGAVVAAIRGACPGVPIGVTTGAWIEPDPAVRLDAIRAWRNLPDYASVNFFEEGAGELARLLLDRGIGVEAGLTASEDVESLTRSGLAANCLRVLVEIQDEDSASAVAAAEALESELLQSSADIPQLHHGTGVATWAVLEAALRRGHDIRVGLEDTLVLASGDPARDNSQLVTAANSLIENL